MGGAGILTGIYFVKEDHSIEALEAKQQDNCQTWYTRFAYLGVCGFGGLFWTHVCISADIAFQIYSTPRATNQPNRACGPWWVGASHPFFSGGRRRADIYVLRCWASWDTRKSVQGAQLNCCLHRISEDPIFPHRIWGGGGGVNYTNTAAHLILSLDFPGLQIMHTGFSLHTLVQTLKFTCVPSTHNTFTMQCQNWFGTTLNISWERGTTGDLSHKIVLNACTASSAYIQAWNFLGDLGKVIVSQFNSPHRVVVRINTIGRYHVNHWVPWRKGGTQI